MKKSTQKILALSGGVGGAKLATGLAAQLQPEQLTIVANTGDDFTHMGLHVSPDLDSLMYALAGLNDVDRGWGMADESWHCMGSLKALGGETWFQLGDRDLATHIWRTHRLSNGYSLSETTRDMCQQLGIECAIVPMTDDAVRTMVMSDRGELTFQDYFVRYQCEPKVTGFRFDGIEQAQPTPQWFQLLSDPELAAIIICPSNPFVSVDPILSLPGVRHALLACHAPVMAVSPIVQGGAIKGPAAKMLQELGMLVSAEAVAEYYRGIVDRFVLDKSDQAIASTIEELGMEVITAETIMKSLADKQQLACTLLEQLGL